MKELARRQISAESLAAPMEISITRKRLGNNRDVLSWHGTKSPKIEKSDPAAFGEKLRYAR